MKKLLYLFSFAAIVSSCTGNNDDGPSATEDFLIKKIVFNDGETTITSKISYNDHKITGTVDSDGTHTVVTYTGDLITKWESFFGNQVVERETFEYNAQGQLTTYTDIEFEDGYGEKFEYTHNSDGTISFDRFYGDANAQDTFEFSGRIYADKLEQYSTDPDLPTTTTTYVFDSKNNPFMNITGYGKIAFAAGQNLNYMNNIVEERYNGTLYNSSTFTYNSHDFPVTETETEEGETYTTKYFY
ncbi:hypothetical protein [Flavobacterium sp. 3HN19-14]|uniref:hypothetical protein n=1 Tax=Flavobacterium sp. 3HN19-14 TaxID=3448133 RepID=UPI003EE03BA5